MPVTYSTVACAEVSHSVSENATENGPNARVQLRCAWAVRAALVADIVGNLKEYPRVPGCKAYAQSASVTPAPGGETILDGQGNIYDEAIVTVNYSQLKTGSGGGDTQNGQLFSESLEPSAEFTTLNHKDFRWGSATGDELEPQEAPGKLQIGMDYVLTRYNVTSIPAAILNNVGTVNASAISSYLLGLNFAAETALLCPVTPNRQIDASGTGKWTLPVRFSIKPSGWNRFWRAKTQSYEEIWLADGGVYKSYPLSNMASLLLQ